MKKHSRILKSLLAIVIAILMVGSVIPTVALAGGNDVIIEEDNEINVDAIVSAFEEFIESVKVFIQKMIDYFKGLFGEKPVDPNGTAVASEAALRGAVANAKEVYLTEDISFNGTLEIKKDIEINLNGKTLTVDRVLVEADATIDDGVIVQAEPEIKNEYGFDLHGNSAIYVEEGTLTLNDTQIVTEAPGTLMIRNNSTIEIVGINIVGGAVVMNNSSLVIENKEVYGNLIQYETLLGACIDGGTLTMNDSSISLKGLGGRDGTEYIAFVAREATEKTVNLNNTQIDGAFLYAVCTGSNLTINTTDAESSWAGKYANCTVNFAEAAE